jgi:hypothetical protein
MNYFVYYGLFVYLGNISRSENAKSIAGQARSHPDSVGAGLPRDAFIERPAISDACAVPL